MFLSTGFNRGSKVLGVLLSSIAHALASLAPKPRPFVRALPPGLPKARADRRPGTGSLALSSHAAFEDLYDPDV